MIHKRKYKALSKQLLVIYGKRIPICIGDSNFQGKMIFDNMAKRMFCIDTTSEFIVRILS